MEHAQASKSKAAETAAPINNPDPAKNEPQDQALVDSPLLLQTTLNKLKDGFSNLKSARELAAFLEIKYSTLVYHTFTAKDEMKYAVFEIKKRNGNPRKICAPKTAIKLIQQKLNYVFQRVYKPKMSTHGFVLDRSIVTNAKTHVGKRYVLNVDLQDFFPTITFPRVRGMFMAVPYNFNNIVATFLARICCCDGKLPQGAPTSPTISNMICSKMDSQLTNLAKDNQCRYSRYADDLTFSCSTPYFPTGLAKFVSIHETQIGGRLKNIIKENGFIINLDKVRLQTSAIRQEVTGLTTNKSLNVKHKFIRDLRAMIHAWDKFGYDKAETEYYTKPNYLKKSRASFMAKPRFANVVRGKIEFLGMVKGKGDPVYIKYRTLFDSLPKPIWQKQ